MCKLSHFFCSFQIHNKKNSKLLNLLYKKLVEIQKLNWSKSAKNIVQNAGFCIKIIKIFVEANPLPSSSDHLHGPCDKDYQNFGRAS